MTSHEATCLQESHLLRHYSFWICVALISLYHTTPAECQKSVTGKVVDLDTKSPIKEVSVMVKGRDAKSMTNHKGYFEITVDSLDALLLIHEDYETAELKIPPSGNFQVSLRKKPISVYTDGNDAFYQFIGENINFPVKARSSGKSGYVYISFQIDSVGQLTNIAIAQDIGGGCAEEVIRVLKKLPGEFIGNRDHSTFILPVLFRNSYSTKKFSPPETMPGKILPELVVTSYAN